MNNTNNNIKNIKLIATDLDGTLLNNQNEISEYNKEIFAYLEKKGVEIVLSTGRPYDGMIRYKKHLNNKNHSIVLNGSMIVDKNGDFVYDEPLDKETAEKIMNIYKKYEDVYLHVYRGNKCVISKEDYYFKRYAEKENIEGIFKGLENIDNFKFSKMLFIGGREVLEEIQLKIKSEVQVHTSFSHNNFLEILRNGINKGAALKWLCDKKGIKRENIMAFGDNYNDIEMIEYAGTGVAMENGEEELKNKADYIAINNNDDGVGKFLKDFLNL